MLTALSRTERLMLWLEAGCELPSFAKQCQKGYACGGTCISRNRKCRKELSSTKQTLGNLVRDIQGRLGMKRLSKSLMTKVLLGEELSAQELQKLEIKDYEILQRAVDEGLRLSKGALDSIRGQLSEQQMRQLEASNRRLAPVGEVWTPGGLRKAPTTKRNKRKVAQKTAPPAEDPNKWPEFKDLPELRGTPKQVEWAKKLRARTLDSLKELFEQSKRGIALAKDEIDRETAEVERDFLREGVKHLVQRYTDAEPWIRWRYITDYEWAARAVSSIPKEKIKPLLAGRRFKPGWPTAFHTTVINMIERANTP